MSKFIYVIKSVSVYGEICHKIGITKSNPIKRLKQLQTGNPNKLEIVKTFKSEFANLVESTLHRRYEMYRLEGEWFDIDVDIIADFEKSCQQLEDNFSLLSESNDYFKKNYLI